MWHLCLYRYLSAKLKSGEVGAKWYASERRNEDGGFFIPSGSIYTPATLSKVDSKIVL